MAWTTVLLRKAEGNYDVSLHLLYDKCYGLDPERYLIERDLLATVFDQEVRPKYQLNAPRVRAVIEDFQTALDRYFELLRNWRASESYVHPKIFRDEKPWVDGAPQP